MCIRDRIKGLVSPGIYWAVENGMDMKIVPYRKISIPKAYAEATEKYGGQAVLTDDNSVDNWVAGRPFPIIDENDPRVAAKLMHNFQRTHYFTDDLNVHLPDADTGNFYVDASGNRRYNVEKHFIVDWNRVLSFQGRLKHDPIHEIDDNRDETFRKQGFYPLIEPFDLKGVGVISYRYLSPERQDDTWLYVPVIRRVRRMSSAQRARTHCSDRTSTLTASAAMPDRFPGSIGSSSGPRRCSPRFTGKTCRRCPVSATAG